MPIGKASETGDPPGGAGTEPSEATVKKSR